MFLHCGLQGEDGGAGLFQVGGQGGDRVADELYEVLDLHWAFSYQAGEVVDAVLEICAGGGGWLWGGDRWKCGVRNSDFNACLGGGRGDIVLVVMFSWGGLV